jgi:uncharacterized protein YecE (DUF72 family)
VAYYSKFFKTVEMDSTFYEKFYSQMTKGTFYGMVKAAPEKFQFSVKVPETVTHDKRLNVEKDAISSLEEFLDKISPLKTANKQTWSCANPVTAKLYCERIHGHRTVLGKTSNGL